MMEYRMMVIFLCLSFGIANAIMNVQIGSAWKKDFGWEVTCSWELFSNDSLQSVRLYNNEQQFMIYRPETDGTQRSRSFRLDNEMKVNCVETEERGVRGKCIVTVELYQPQKNSLTFTCEASGEGRLFLIKKADIVIPAFVPPTEAFIEATSTKNQSNRVVLNCTSSGIPKPNLVWTIGELEVPRDFTGSYWNMTSKLWHSWSQLSYTPSYEHPSAICTPEVSKGRQMERGKPAEYLYNSANWIIGVRKVHLILLPLLLLR